MSNHELRLTAHVKMSVHGGNEAADQQIRSHIDDARSRKVPRITYMRLISVKLWWYPIVVVSHRGGVVFGLSSKPVFPLLSPRIYRN